MWKDAQGKDLPEIDKEVIALVGVKDPTANDCFYAYKVVFAHRPDPREHKVRSLTTNEISTYAPKCYDTGGWNQPDVIYWLDLPLPELE